MKKTFTSSFTNLFLLLYLPVRRARRGKALLFYFFIFSVPFSGHSQGLIFSYSYENVTRNNGGGSLETGDTIEVHALLKVDKTASNVYYIDTIRTGTEFISGSLKVVTNEGLLFRGPFTNGAGDDEGVYDASGIPRLRVNLGAGAAKAQAGAGFGNASGGGKITPGDRPKFYGTTLLMVAYRLRISADFNDTIFLTGNYYFDTSGVARTYRFDYAGIRVIQNTGFCLNHPGASFTADSSFKSGNKQNRTLAAVAPGYIKINLGPNSPNDNYYAIANNTSADGSTDNTGPYKPANNAHRVFGGYWDIIGDHTGAADPEAGNLPVAPGTNGGYMLVVNAAYPTGEAYRETIMDLCPDTYYEFSAWVRNICGVCGIDSNSIPTYTPGVLPNLSFAVNGVDYYTTGDLPHTNKWVKRGFLYKTGPGETSFTLSIKNNAAGGGGNDWVLDDIKLSHCYPDLIMNPHDTIPGCAGFPVLVSDTVKSFFNSYVYYAWELSTNGGHSWTTLTSTRNKATPVMENGYWTYHVDTVFTPAAADSGKLIRLKVATTENNLFNSSCSVDQSQNIFLKIFSNGCTVLHTKLSGFNGMVAGNKNILQWQTENEEEGLVFDIERSPDGISFQSIQQVRSLYKASGGRYMTDDADPGEGAVYYRIRITGKNSPASYSKVIIVYGRSRLFNVTVVNPFRSMLKINAAMQANGELDLRLFDMYGKLVKHTTLQAAKGNTEIAMDGVSGLQKGIYILRTVCNGIMQQVKLVKTD